eukprot:scaffold45774_cov204-Skeletonema_marinoi.AAC.1
MKKQRISRRALASNRAPDMSRIFNVLVAFKNGASEMSSSLFMLGIWLMASSLTLNFFSFFPNNLNSPLGLTNSDPKRLRWLILFRRLLTEDKCRATTSVRRGVSAP